MDVKSRVLNHLQRHYKKILVVLSSVVAVYFLHKYIHTRMFRRKPKREPIKDFPTIEDIQQFIEDLPFDAMRMDKTITLKDLLGELSEFSEDEEWKELIASVHSLYQDSPRSAGGNGDASSPM